MNLLEIHFLDLILIINDNSNLEPISKLNRSSANTCQPCCPCMHKRPLDNWTKILPKFRCSGSSLPQGSFIPCWVSFLPIPDLHGRNESRRNEGEAEGVREVFVGVGRETEEDHREARKAGGRSQRNFDRGWQGEAARLSWISVVGCQPFDFFEQSIWLKNKLAVERNWESSLRLTKLLPGAGNCPFQKVVGLSSLGQVMSCSGKFLSPKIRLE